MVKRGKKRLSLTAARISPRLRQDKAANHTAGARRQRATIGLVLANCAEVLAIDAIYGLTRADAHRIVMLHPPTHEPSWLTRSEGTSNPESTLDSAPRLANPLPAPVALALPLSCLLDASGVV